MHRLLLVLALLVLPPVACAAPISLVDAAGRTVELAGPARRVVLADALDILTLSFLLDDPLAPVAGWAGADRLDENLAARLHQGFPSAAAVKSVGLSASELSAEAIIAAAPDLLIAGGGTTPTDPVLARIAEAGIATLFIYPPPGRMGEQGADVERAISLLGAAFGTGERAERFVTFHRARIDGIRDRLRTVADRPSVLVEAHAGSQDCCWSPGAETDYVEFAGGRNLGAGLSGIEAGRLSLEYIIAADPDVVIGTGGIHMRPEGGLVLGAGVSAGEAAQSFARIRARPGFDTLTAVRTGRVYGIWHQLLGTPFDLVALEAMARWIHPALFADLDPSATLRAIDGFTALPLSGTFLIEPAS